MRILPILPGINTNSYSTKSQNSYNYNINPHIVSKDTVTFSGQIDKLHTVTSNAIENVDLEAFIPEGNDLVTKLLELLKRGIELCKTKDRVFNDISSRINRILRDNLFDEHLFNSNHIDNSDYHALIAKAMKDGKYARKTLSTNDATGSTHWQILYRDESDLSEEQLNFLTLRSRNYPDSEFTLFIKHKKELAKHDVFKRPFDYDYYIMSYTDKEHKIAQMPSNNNKDYYQTTYDGPIFRTNCTFDRDIDDQLIVYRFRFGEIYDKENEVFFGYDYNNSFINQVISKDKNIIFDLKNMYPRPACIYQSFPDRKIQVQYSLPSGLRLEHGTEQLISTLEQYKNPISSVSLFQI